MKENSVIRTENLTKEFKANFLSRRQHTKALDNLNLVIESGEIFGYLGPNGAGKTTTFKLLLGLIFPTSGTAWVLGRNIREVSFKREVGFLPEQPYFYDYLTGEEFLDFYAQFFRFDKKARKRKVRKLLQSVGLEKSASVQLRKFSRGMLQRIGIAQALVNDPELVILDEPLSGLDPVGRKEIRNIILDLRNQGRTVIFSSHVLSDVEAICDRVGILLQGKLQRIERLDAFLNIEVESVELAASGLDEMGISAIESLGGQIMNVGNKTVVGISDVRSPGGEGMLTNTMAVIRESGAKLISITSQTRSLEDLFTASDSAEEEAEEALVQD
jgi:ABC-2 type transport system ATP-binding protein